MSVMSLPLEIASMVSSSAACDTRIADEIVNYLVSERPYAAAAISVYDPLTTRYHSIASTGYDDRVSGYLNSDSFDEDPAMRLYHAQGQSQVALKWAEMPFDGDYRDTFPVQEYYHPAGFREGITLLLHSRDGRHTGNLNISTDDPRFPSEQMLRAEVQQLQLVLGGFTDALRRLAPMSVDSELAQGCIVTEAGDVIDLPGTRSLESTIRGSLLSQLAGLTDSAIPAAFYFRADSTWFRVQTGVVGERSRVVVAEPEPIPFSLTPRELEVIDPVASGATNDEIAAKLYVSRATVAKHLENILHKLDCPNRTAAAHKALVHHLRALPSW
ncbi:MAG: LuxR family transcriptional regulator [Glaciihabitans sp.]|nr:LuxR family transcriptional regulator [Glaciihabitans sp.]